VKHAKAQWYFNREKALISFSLGLCSFFCTILPAYENPPKASDMNVANTEDIDSPLKHSSLHIFSHGQSIDEGNFYVLVHCNWC
jgi:hypothetical protein